MNSRPEVDCCMLLLDHRTDRMRRSAHILLLVLIIGTKSTLCLESYRQEAHSIMKRMAGMDQGFEGHDVARVHLAVGQGQLGRRLAKRDLHDVSHTSNTTSGKRNLALALSSGSTVNFDLKPAGIVDHETLVSYHTSRRKIEGSLAKADCYSHGHVEDSSGKGWAAISQCNGVFGFANSGGYEYFLHPVESKRSKRDTTIENDDDYDVHVMWRRSAQRSQDSKNSTDFLGSGEAAYDYYRDIARRVRRDSADQENATGFVVELAMFSDSRYCQQLQALYPGREDDFLLTRLAGVQALFSNREKVGYDVQIKLKRLEYWHTDPENYTFTESFSKNLRAFCDITTQQYYYDVHALNTGIVKWNDGLIGLAFVGGACTGSRCMVVKGTDLDTFKGYAHELGHILGMSHHSSCPEDLKAEGGFMGGGTPLNFSPCMKRMLDTYLATTKSNCLFVDSGMKSFPEEFDILPSLYPGQVKSPDELCQLLAGPDFRFVQNGASLGSKTCRWFMCLNDNEASAEFRRARFFPGKIGLPCKAESFCDSDRSCKSWGDEKMALKADTLRSLTKIPEWSEWSTEFTHCSRSCGTGIRTRRRVCQYPRYNLSPYCPGRSVDPEVCNTHPCPGVELSNSEVKAAMGDEVCERFLRANVSLRLKKADAFLPKATGVTIKDVGPNIAVYTSPSCLMGCERQPSDVTGDLDAVLPDGAPCDGNKRTMYDLDRLNITMRCIGGHCLEVTNCPHILQTKDDCGICGGDGSRCVKLDFNSSYSVMRKARNFLTVIPTCSRNIDVRADPKKNVGVVLELWSNDDVKVIADGGPYPRTEEYKDSTAVDFAGTRWTYVPSKAYLRAPGPLTEPVIIKYKRLGAPLEIITINYANSI